MEAQVRNFIIEQGSYFEATIVYIDSITNQPINLLDYEIKGQIRPFAGSSDVILSFTTTDDANMEKAEDNLSVKWFIYATQSASFNFEKAYYDIEAIPNENEQLAVRLVKGQLTLAKEITRE